MTGPMIDPAQQQPAGPPQPPVPPTPPWTPFQALPMDAEPRIAALRMRRLGLLMAKGEFTAQSPEWQSVAIDAYNQAAQAVQASMPAPPLPKGVNIQDKVAGGNIAAEEQAAAHPGAQPQGAPR